MTRDESRAAAFPASGIVVYLALHGTSHFIHRDGEESLVPGQGIILDADRLFERSFIQEPLETELIDLVAELVSTGSALDQLAVAEAFIHAHFRRPDHSARGITAAVGISERHLSRIFYASGRRVPQAVLAAQLEAAHQMLSSADLAGILIAESATRCGFSSQEQFSRDYRLRFGRPPLRHRRELLRQADGR